MDAGLDTIVRAIVWGIFLTILFCIAWFIKYLVVRPAKPDRDLPNVHVFYNMSMVTTKTCTYFVVPCRRRPECIQSGKHATIYVSRWDYAGVVRTLSLLG